jgi:hypothetical protein
MSDESTLQEGAGCAATAIGVAIAIVLIIWALTGFPGLRC